MTRSVGPRIVLVALAIVAVLLAGWWYLLRPDSRAPAPPDAPAAAAERPTIDTVRYPAGAPQLDMIEAHRFTYSPLPASDELPARLVYDEDATARLTVAVPGRIVAIRVSAGDAVKAGQVLAEVDSPEFGGALADLDKARADERRKKLVADRARALSSGQGMAAKDVELALADHAQARSETARAELRLRNLNPRGIALSGQRVALTAPIDGIVTERAVTPGLEVSPGGPPLFVVSDLHRLWMMIDLPERLLSQVRLGGLVSVTSDAYPNDRFWATVIQLGQAVDTRTRRVSVRARLDAPDSRLLPEMFVRAAILEGNGTGIEIPNTAIVYRGVNDYVFVRTGPGEFQRRQVFLQTRGSESSYVGDGLRDGEDVVTAGAMLLDAELSALGADRQ